MSDTRKPVKYTVVEKSLVGNTLFDEGAIVEYDGLPAENLKPMCEEGEARYQEYLTSNAERVAKMQRDNAPIGAFNAEDFMKAFRQELLDSQAAQAETIAAAVAAAVSGALNKPAVATKSKTTAGIPAGAELA